MPRPQFARLTYRSVATREISPRELEDLCRQSRHRNVQESVTGLLIHDRGRFVQWLEGPPAGLRRIWRSISADVRHCHLDRLQTSPRPLRLFPHDALLLGMAAPAGIQDAIRIPADVLLELAELPDETQEIIEGIAFRRAMPSTEEIAGLLARGSNGSLQSLRSVVAMHAPSWRVLGTHLFRPVSCALGDAWADDSLGPAELAIAQARLQNLLRDLTPRSLALHATCGQALVVLMPGETDACGLTYAGMGLDGAGWEVSCAFPRTSAELVRLAARPGLDLLHIALSDALRREHRMTELAAMLEDIRSAAANPALQITVGGRAFAEQRGLAVLIGADGDLLTPGSRPQDPGLQPPRTDRPPAAELLAAQASLRDLSRRIRLKRYASGDHPQAIHSPP